MSFPSDLVRTKNWSTELLLDTDLEAQLDLIIDWVMAALNSAAGHAHTGVANKSPKINVADGLTVTNQAQGDALYASSATAFARLGAGTKGKCFTTGGAAANPSWEGMTTEGDIEYHDGTNRARLAKGTAGQILQMNAGATVPEWASKGIVQVVNVMSGAVASNAATIPYDDSKPQIGEGAEYMTRAITPTSATNGLKIEVVFNGSLSAADVLTVALFQDATADALAAVAGITSTATWPQNQKFTFYMIAGTALATTFRVRAGGNSGTTTFNGSNAARKLGGVMASSITITEIQV